jgi:hypothetical protein
MSSEGNAAKRNTAERNAVSAARKTVSQRIES